MFSQNALPGAKLTLILEYIALPRGDENLKSCASTFPGNSRSLDADLQAVRVSLFCDSEILAEAASSSLEDVVESYFDPMWKLRLIKQ